MERMVCRALGQEKDCRAKVTVSEGILAKTFNTHDDDISACLIAVMLRVTEYSGKQS